MRRFTNQEKIDGEMAVREMSEKAKRFYNGTDLIAVYKYVDTEASAEAEEKAFENDVDFYPGELDVIRYAINFGGEWTTDLTLEEAQQYLEDMDTEIEESEDFDA